MIKPSELDLSTLPWVPLCATAGFPSQPGIYFAIDSQGTIQYIGRSNNVRGRWKNHHRYDELAAIGGVRIVYLSIEAPELLPPIEAALIDWFQPSLNVVGIKQHHSDVANNYERPDEWIHGEKKSGKQFMLTESASMAIDVIAKNLGISRSEVVERAARCGGMAAAGRYSPETGACTND